MRPTNHERDASKRPSEVRVSTTNVARIYSDFEVAEKKGHSIRQIHVCDNVRAASVSDT